MADGMVLSRVMRTNYCIVDKRTPSLRGEVLGAGTTGPAVARVGAVQLNWVSSSYCPKRDEFAFRRSEISPLRVGVGPQANAMENHTAARRAQAQGAGGVHSSSWNNLRSVSRAGGRLKPEGKVTIGRDRPPALGGDAVTFEARISCCLLGVRATDAYRKPKWKGPGSREGARAGRFDNPNDGG